MITFMTPAPPAGFNKGQFVPVAPEFGKQIQSINQRVKSTETPERVVTSITLWGGAVGSPRNTTTNPAPPTDEALALLRQNDRHQMFEDALSYRRQNPDKEAAEISQLMSDEIF
jgi:hypothetical protein